MKTIFKDKSFRLSFIITMLFMSVGFAFLHFGLADYGWVFFILLPIVLGISIGALPSYKWVTYGALFGLLIFITMLIIGKAEGFICVLMTLPILIPLIFLGTVISKLAKIYKKRSETDEISILLMPLVIFLFAAPIEKMLTSEKKEIINIQTERVYPYTTLQVYDDIKNVDTLIAEKPFLMKIDLPIPNKCILEKEAVGGLRTCYFSGGTITEKITELEKAKVLRMDVIDYKLTGRKWLGFKEAIYYFDKVGTDSCKLTRITTYTSELKPRLYWAPLEKLGIQQEHDYVFDNLANDLKKKFGN
jgi:hypothetical protein